MTSVNTNAAALTALRTLQQTNASMESTQNRISTGYAIGEAKDNAAYWSISTTLKSDNKSLSTVKDALGLGAATVDVAYEGLNSAKDVLDEIKSKLQAATQDGLNKDTIQKEIAELQKQLKSIASSSTFSGENWLSIDSSAANYTSIKTVVASFNRELSGTVSLGTIDVNVSDVALFDASNAAGAGGILDKLTSLVGSDGRNLTIGGVSTATGNISSAGLVNRAVTGSSVTHASGSQPVPGANATATSAVGGDNAANAAAILSGAVNLTDVANGDTMTLKFKIDSGAEQEITITKNSGITDADTLATALQARLTALGIDSITIDNGATATTKLLFERKSTEFLTGNTIQITDFVLRDSSGHAKNPANAVLGTGFLKGDTSTDPAVSAGFTSLVVSTAESYKTAALNGGSGWTSRFATDDLLSVNLTVDAQTFSVEVAAGASIGDFINNLNANSTFATYAKASGTTDLTITSGSTGSASEVTFNSVVFKDKDGVVKAAGSGSGFEKIGQAAVTTTSPFSSITLDSDDNIVFDVKLNAETAAKTVTIDKKLIDSALGAAANGRVTTTSDFKKVVEAAFTKAGVTGIKTEVDGTGLKFTTTKVAGANANITFSNVGASGGGSQISVGEIDISSAKLAELGATSAADVRNVLKAYINVIDAATAKVKDAAANLGSASSRIDLQQKFVSTLMDTIDVGVGNLIDADMSEESTKLQALQVKQQLGVQALSIANQSAQQLLRLFQ